MLARPRSASKRQVSFPIAANWMARLRLILVLPTPPFPLVIVMVLPMPALE